MEPPPGDVPVWSTTFSDAGDATGPFEVPLPLWPGDTGPLLLPEPSCPGATRLTLVDTILRSLGSMDACGDSRLTSPLPEGLLLPEHPPEELPPGETVADPEPFELPETPGPCCVSS